MLEYKKSGYTKEIVIQTLLYLACEEVGLTCDLEYIVQTGNFQECRFDLVVIENYEIIAIVEVKGSQCTAEQALNSKQIHKYKKYNVPVFVLCSKYDIPYLVKKLLVVRDRFLEKVNPERVKCLTADKKSKELKQFELDLVFNAFNQVFPEYEHVEKYSLELLATAVEKLGLREVIRKLSANDLTIDFLLDDLKSYIDWTKRIRTAHCSLFQTH